MEAQPVLDMESLDVTAGTWEDLEREVLADDPAVVAPLFVGDSWNAGVPSHRGGGCVCSGCITGCSCQSDDGCNDDCEGV